MPITPVGTHRTLFQTVAPARPQEAPAIPQLQSSPDGKQTGFGTQLTQALEQVNELQLEANQQLTALASGQTDNIQEAIMALNKADLALQLTIQITNRAVDAYKQVSQMQV